jgi:hypothetical protein
MLRRLHMLYNKVRRAGGKPSGTAFPGGAKCSFQR